jgi:hypothetical protein
MRLEPSFLSFTGLGALPEMSPKEFISVPGYKKD